MVLPNQKVTLVLPWVCEADQNRIYPCGVNFKEHAAQAAWIRSWVKLHLDFKTNIEEHSPIYSHYPHAFISQPSCPMHASTNPGLWQISFYEAQYRPEFGSIFPLSDITESVLTFTFSSSLYLLSRHKFKKDF
jgi:hypothetical protein